MSLFGCLDDDNDEDSKARYIDRTERFTILIIFLLLLRQHTADVDSMTFYYGWYTLVRILRTSFRFFRFHLVVD